MKVKLFFTAGLVCLAITSYEFYASNSLFYAIMDGTTGRDKEYTALQTVFFERYEHENIYHIVNLDTVQGISILLGILAVVFFILTLIYNDNSHVKNKLDTFIKKTVILVLILCACGVTFLNLWTIM